MLLTYTSIKVFYWLSLFSIFMVNTMFMYVISLKNTIGSLTLDLEKTRLTLAAFKHELDVTWSNPSAAMRGTKRCAARIAKSTMHKNTIVLPCAHAFTINPCFLKYICFICYFNLNYVKYTAK